MSIDVEHINITEPALNLIRQYLDSTANTLIIGAQGIAPALKNRQEYRFSSVADMFRSYGWKATQLDMHDPSAEFRYDLNDMPANFEYGVYDLVYDIGTLEHVADSQAALEVYLRALRVNGILFLLTPVKGYYDHGLHTFSPEYILDTLEINGAVPYWKKYVTMSGQPVDDPIDGDDVLIVLLAVKNKETPTPFKFIQQQRWIK